jgi:hypothetical protein
MELNSQKKKDSRINWLSNNDQEKNYAPKLYPYWSSGAGPRQNVYRKKK